MSDNIRECVSTKENMQKEQFAEKLKVALKNKGYEARAAVLEREFNLRYLGKNITLHAAAKWLRGEAIPRYDKIMTLSKWLQVPPEALVYGADIKQAEVTESFHSETDAGYQERILDVAASLHRETSIGYQERALFELFLHLPAPQRMIVREIIIVFNKLYGTPMQE